MTYCVAMLLDTGLVFLSDSRTSAGVDQINSFRKTAVFQRPGERVLVLQAAGNLAITQAVVTMLRGHADSKEPSPLDLMAATDMFTAARCVGDALREVHRRDAGSLKDFGLEFNASIILGGQIRGEQPRLFSIYSAGNFIEASPDTTYFQIGESKYGKPIIDRVIRRSSSLNEACKCALVSMDSTIRSNLSVGLPLDLVILRRDQFAIARHMSIDEDNVYFRGIRSRWSAALREAFAELPDPDWLSDRPGERTPPALTSVPKL
ncbi:MAG TPA: proteasome-type protease [Steroidobacteraceae bacterium]|nr:proteasome-type protease [Steroidobacteraceae bacterium]